MKYKKHRRFENDSIERPKSPVLNDWNLTDVIDLRLIKMSHVKPSVQKPRN